MSTPQRERFRPHRVQRLLRELLAERLAGQAYDPVRGPQLCKQLADDVREGVKALDYERYKLIVQARTGAGVHIRCNVLDPLQIRPVASCQVTLGEKHGQTFHAASRCLWDSGADGHASETYQSTTLFCNCQVYALYFE